MSDSGSGPSDKVVNQGNQKKRGSVGNRNGPLDSGNFHTGGQLLDGIKITEDKNNKDGNGFLKIKAANKG